MVAAGGKCIPARNQGRFTKRFADLVEVSEGDQMRLARFAVAGNGGEAADVSIIPLGGISAQKDQLLNIWREQIRLPPVDLEQLTNSVQINLPALDATLNRPRTADKT